MSAYLDTEEGAASQGQGSLPMPSHLVTFPILVVRVIAGSRHQIRPTVNSGMQQQECTMLLAACLPPSDPPAAAWR